MSSHFRCPSSSRSVFHDFPASLGPLHGGEMDEMDVGL